MLAQASSLEASPVPAVQIPQQPKPMTMEELEREMMQMHTQSQQQQQQPNPQMMQLQPQTQPQQPPMMMMQPPMQQPQGQPPVDLMQTMFPPLGSEPPKQQQHLDMMQQQLLASLAGPATGLQPPQQEQQEQQQQPQSLSVEELEQKIRETEMADARRRRKALKIASMAKYNDIMTGGDKEFITRIQLSQLVTQDPYSSDFYAQVFTQVARAKAAAAGLPVSGPTVVQVGSDGRGVSALGRSNAGSRIRDSAMQRMTMQVRRIVEKANERKDAASSASLQGALGKIKTRSTAAGPRQALQVTGAAASQAERASHITNLLNHTGSDGDRREPLTTKEVMIKLEALYEMVLDIEQLRRQQPPPPPTVEQQQQIGMSNEEREFIAGRFEQWNAQHQAMVDGLYNALMIQEPLDISDPHPFISLLTPTKGHRLLNRVMRHFSHSQALTVLILLLACYPQLDVVRNSPPWLYAAATINVFSKADMDHRKQKLKETESYLSAVYPIIVGVLGRLDLKMLAGMVSLCLERWDVVQVLSTRPGTALFTAILSRADMLRRPETAAVAAPGLGPGPNTPPSPVSAEDLAQWSQAVGSFVQTIAPRLPLIFPSTQAQTSAFGPALSVLPGGIQGTEMGTADEQEGLYMDAMDGEVWGVLAS